MWRRRGTRLARDDDALLQEEDEEEEEDYEEVDSWVYRNQIFIQVSCCYLCRCFNRLHLAHHLTLTYLITKMPKLAASTDLPPTKRPTSMSCAT